MRERGARRLAAPKLWRSAAESMRARIGRMARLFNHKRLATSLVAAGKAWYKAVAESEGLGTSMNRSFYTIMSAQFFSSLADNALLIAAIAQLLAVDGPAWMVSFLEFFFTRPSCG